MGFPRREYWSGLPFPSPGDLPNPGIKPMSPTLAGGFFTSLRVAKSENTHKVSFSMYCQALFLFESVHSPTSSVWVLSFSVFFPTVFNYIGLNFNFYGHWVHACMLSRFSHIWLFATLWTVTHQAPVRGILQARILEWVAMPSSRWSSWPRDWTCLSYISCVWQAGSLTFVPPRKPMVSG